MLYYLWPIFLFTISFWIVVYMIKTVGSVWSRSRVSLASYFGGKTVLITGASSGLGKSLAFEMNKLNDVKLILASRDVSALHKLSECICSESNNHRNQKPFVFSLDLENSRSIEEFSEKVLFTFPDGIDILINNAGVSVRADCFSTDMNVHRRLMEVNYFGHIQLTQALFNKTVNQSAYQAAQKRTIVCISSIQGRISLPSRSAYGASKHAFNAYFDSLKAELAVQGWDNISVLTVNPGYIHTNLSRNALLSDGSLSGKMDETQKRGMDPALAAKRIMEAMANGETELILADFKTRLAILIRSICPKLYFYLIVKRASKAKG